MENEVKVFHSDITTVECRENDHLYDLLKITPAVPVPQRTHIKNNETWEYIPNYNKQYIPKKSSKLKVKTVREIRTLFEEDVYCYLPDDLRRQEQYLLRKIRDGSSCDEKTKNTAEKLLNNDIPISKSTWQMLVNINPGNHKYPKQFVLWNGKCIQVNGSKGGESRFVCKYDLKYNKKRPLKNASPFKNKMLKSKMVLLRNSLNVKFKPGPLRKKQFLDDSHHKYQMNHIELVKLPTPALEVSPAYGTILEPPISGFINNLRGETGVISQKFAEFATSVVGTTCNQSPTQLEKCCCVTFDLNYKCDQNRLLMRRNTVDTTCTEVWNHNSAIQMSHGSKIGFAAVGNYSDSVYSVENELASMSEIKQIMDDMLNTVEISLMQNSMYYSEDEPREIVTDGCIELNNTTKDKPKRKYCELDKLDVTVIKLPEDSQKDYTKPCGKSFCTLGCICESLDCYLSLKQHCGVVDCMFGCKCEASKYNVIELLDRDCSEIIPGLMNLDNEINSHLAKEEKKFHQTVIVSGERSVLLKSRKRNLKSPNKYAEFYKNTNLRSDEKVVKHLTVDVTNLNCDNIVPLCMVHNLYKCFCKGKFTESIMTNIKNSNENETKISINKNSNLETDVTADINCAEIRRNMLRPRQKTVKQVDSNNICLETNVYDDLSVSCARTTCYYGRKHSDEHYRTTNKKILEMEQNDRLLKKKMMRLINGRKDECPITPDPLLIDSLQTEEQQIEDTPTPNFPQKRNSLQKRNSFNLNLEALNNDEDSNISTSKSEESDYPFSNVAVKNSLKDWLESSYKNYKERRDQGILKSCLDAPKKGKASLQSWDFILSRYRERKNLFFVSNQEPFRTFLAVDGNHPFFENCLNIDDIRFAELHRYPLVIRNLVTNSTDSENSFCILRGWDHCWELIGSAVKVIERVAQTDLETKETSEPETIMNQDDSMENENDYLIDQNSLGSNNSASSQGDKACIETGDINNSERSKWFVMTIENDFNEIQFYNKGFFVTYDGIQRSICLARISGKTVRLSPQARTNKNSAHHFGIYAIPCVNECCVFIGPYEINEPLGIEVVKTYFNSKKRMKTRGVWITTNKVDNMKVIERPLSFMPSTSNDDMVTLESGTPNTKQQLNLDENEKDVDKDTSKKEMTKIVKPIKIRRTNGFYHLTSKNIIHNTSPNKAPLVINDAATNCNVNQIVKKSSLSLLKNPDGTTLKNNSQESSLITSTTYLKPVAEIAPQVSYSEECNITLPTAHQPFGHIIRPVAEIAPQIKITSVYSEAEISINKGTGMQILKPEQINEKIMANTALNDDGMGTDIEKFLETSTICIAPQDEVFLISDGEDEETETLKEIWIQCCNVPNLGCIRGRVNKEKLLSFQFPGFKYSAFYTENEAFNKINQVLARKIYIPKDVKLQWEVTDTEDKRRIVMTSQSLKEKKYLLMVLKENKSKNKVVKTGAIKTVRTYTFARNITDVAGSSTSPSLTSEDLTTANKTDIIDSLEQTSKELENQSTLLWNTAIARRDEIRNSLNTFNSVKPGMTNTLNDIMLLNEPDN